MRVSNSFSDIAFLGLLIAPDKSYRPVTKLQKLGIRILKDESVARIPNFPKCTNKSFQLCHELYVVRHRRKVSILQIWA